MRRSSVAVLPGLLCCACALGPGSDPFVGAHWRLLPSPVPQASLRGLCVVDADVAWASGSGGTVLRTTDGGEHWQQVGPADGGAMDFRDVEAFDSECAVVCVAGQPAHVYRTEDGGRSWQLVHRDEHPAAFFDALAFFDAGAGLLFADPQAGSMRVDATDDGGRTWRRLPAASLPQPAPGEAAFAASGCCLAVAPGGAGFVVTGGTLARCLRTRDRGRSWDATMLPLLQGGDSAGAFAIAFADALRGVVVGGDYRQPERSDGTAAFTTDGGSSFERAAPGPAGYRSGVAFVPAFSGCCVAVGEAGTSVSCDGGASWRELSAEGFHSVAARGDAVFAVGARGRIASLAWSGRRP